MAKQLMYGDAARASVLRGVNQLADAVAVRDAAPEAHKALVVGGSFIGSEVAASLRNRGIEVHVAAPEKVPMERVLGAEMGKFVRALHEEHVDPAGNP